MSWFQGLLFNFFHDEKLLHHLYLKDFTQENWFTSRKKKRRTLFIIPHSVGSGSSIVTFRYSVTPSWSPPKLGLLVLIDNCISLLFFFLGGGPIETAIWAHSSGVLFPLTPKEEVLQSSQIFLIYRVFRWNIYFEITEVKKILLELIDLQSWSWAFFWKFPTQRAFFKVTKTAVGEALVTKLE